MKEDGSSPFQSWLEKFSIRECARIQARILRFKEGNFGDWKVIGEGIKEARLMFGPGYRIYYGIDGVDIVILLCGGQKKSQKRDIGRARKYWKDYIQRSDEDE